MIWLLYDMLALTIDKNVSSFWSVFLSLLVSSTYVKLWISSFLFCPACCGAADLPMDASHCCFSEKKFARTAEGRREFTRADTSTFCAYARIVRFPRPSFVRFEFLIRENSNVKFAPFSSDSSCPTRMKTVTTRRLETLERVYGKADTVVAIELYRVTVTIRKKEGR